LKYEAVVEVLLKDGVSDPEGVAILDAVVSLGYGSVSKVASGKLFRLLLQAEDENSAADVVSEIAERLLSNPVLEDFRVRDLVSSNS
jgi:phosphoribosylformylglycinamidine synthase